MESYTNLWEVTVLALLREESMHPYQMQRLLRYRHKDELLTLKRGSLYHAINRLISAGLIMASETGRSGRRPERTTYRITAEGRKTLIRVLRQMVRTPRHETPEFMAAMSHLPQLDTQDAIAMLEERVQRLEIETRALKGVLKAALEQVRRLHLIESEYLLAMRQAELKWVRGLLSDLRSGELAWDLREIFREVRADRKAAASAKEKQQ
jgi:DNA-binding PadR family transcriptional regulator